MVISCKDEQFLTLLEGSSGILFPCQMEKRSLNNGCLRMMNVATIFPEMANSKTKKSLTTHGCDVSSLLLTVIIEAYVADRQSLKDMLQWLKSSK